MENHDETYRTCSGCKFYRSDSICQQECPVKPYLNRSIPIEWVLQIACMKRMQDEAAKIGYDLNMEEAFAIWTSEAGFARDFTANHSKYPNLTSQEHYNKLMNPAPQPV